MNERALHPNIEAVIQTVEGLYKMLGSRYEIIVHDLSHVESSIVSLHGTITGRHIGGPVTNYLLQILKTYGDEAPNSINYKNVLPDGRVLRSSTMFIRDNESHIIGSLCINQDMTDYIVTSKLLREMTNFEEQKANEIKTDEIFTRDINEMMESVVRSELNMGSKPAAYMQKEDKLAFVKDLESKGIFDVKGAVEFVAECLGVTNFTIYNYLKEVRGSK